MHQVHFSQFIRPSDVTIDIFGSRTAINTYLSFFTWAGSCIGHFPSPSHLRRLTIKVCVLLYSDSDASELAYPRCTDYITLSQRIVQLCEHGTLESVRLSFKIFLSFELEVDPDAVYTREGPKLLAGFAPLLSVNGSSPRFLSGRMGKCLCAAVHRSCLLSTGPVLCFLFRPQPRANSYTTHTCFMLLNLRRQTFTLAGYNMDHLLRPRHATALGRLSNDGEE